MRLNLDQHSPIYRQIIDEFKRSIARGDLRPGDRIPSQRELAAMVKVNPNTVQRAYREMEQEGVTETLRGQGTFISTEPGLLAAIRREMAGRALAGFVREMHALGFGCEEMTEMVRSAYRQVIEAGTGRESSPHPGADPPESPERQGMDGERGEADGDGGV